MVILDENTNSFLLILNEFTNSLYQLIYITDLY